MSRPKAWLRRGLAAWSLWPVSGVYAALVALRRAAFRAGFKQTTKLPVPVIVVGNVVAGGSGKTPAVIAIVDHLRAQGHRPGVISRGHGRSTRDCREVDAQSDARDVGDEPKMIQSKTGVPLFVAVDRPDAARALLACHPEVDCIVSDDGLQHLALGRDLEICTFDDDGIGNGFLLPAGPLREAWPRSCDLVLHTGPKPAFAGFRSERALADFALDASGRRVALDSLRKLAGGSILALAGIGRPEAFFEMLAARGLPIDRSVALADHAALDDWQPPPGFEDATLLCTEKDAVKLWRRWPSALAVPLLFTPEPAFLAALDAKLSSIDGHQAA
ncbi:Tetraacyldisaccharide 4'-kinase [Burkholderiales bacterium 8X]|nr:Tetraacyldisaccharide 4'-kinase [Burkholderiales bacterium 8X]